jgi:hypothetical protein
MRRPQDLIRELDGVNRQNLQAKVATVSRELLAKNGFISPVEVLMSIGKLSKEDHERWRFRQIPYLEKVLPGSLNQLQFLLRALREIARDELALHPSRTVYTSWGKGARQKLRFSKYGNPYLEELYSTHYVGRNVVA